MSSVDAFVGRFNGAFRMFVIFWVSLHLLPIFFVLRVFQYKLNSRIVDRYFEVLAFSYFAVFEALIHGDTP